MEQVSNESVIVELSLRTWAGSLQRGGNVKVIIVRDECCGDSHCASIAPNVFELDAHFKLAPKGDDGKLILKAAKAGLSFRF